MEMMYFANQPGLISKLSLSKFPTYCRLFLLPVRHFAPHLSCLPRNLSPLHHHLYPVLLISHGPKRVYQIYLFVYISYLILKWIFIWLKKYKVSSMDVYMEEKQANRGKGGNSVNAKAQGSACRQIQHTSDSYTLGNFPYKEKAVNKII